MRMFVCLSFRCSDARKSLLFALPRRRLRVNHHPLRFSFSSFDDIIKPNKVMAFVTLVTGDGHRFWVPKELVCVHTRQRYD
jgi:hypothetical protein